MTEQEFLDALAARLAGTSATAANKTSTTVSKDAIKLTEAGARQLLDSIMADIQFTGKLSKQDLADFVKKYNEAANKQLETVVQTVRNQTKPGATAEDIKTIIKTSTPSFFQPKEFTKDYLWSKVSFADEKNLGAKALDALTTARQIAKSFNLSIMSDVEIQDAAKKIATGKITADDYKTQLAAKAAIEYPQYAERFKNTPGATTRDFANPILKAIADAWEIDVNTLELNDPFVDKLIRPDGTVGKLPSASIGEALNAAMMHPNRDKTMAENNRARQAATSFAQALGYGVRN
jgi:hypothetical protein